MGGEGGFLIVATEDPKLLFSTMRRKNKERRTDGKRGRNGRMDGPTEEEMEEGRKGRDGRTGEGIEDGQSCCRWILVSYPSIIMY